MNILVICQYYYPEPFRITDICEELVRRGHSVTVVTGTPNYPMGEIYKGYEDQRRADEILNGVKVHRCPSSPRRSGSFHRLRNYFSFSFLSKRYVKSLQSDFDVVFVNQLSPVMMAKAGVWYRNKYHKKLVLYCLDLWPESLCVGGVKRNSLIYRFFYFISRTVYRSADKILITSQSFEQYFREKFGLCGQAVTYLPQYAEDLFFPLGEKKQTEAFQLLFAGNIGIAQSVCTIMRAARLLKNENVIFHIVGDGSELDLVRKMASDLPKVVFYGRRELSEMPLFYQMADAMLVTLVADPVISFTLPGKVQTYMAAGKPIIGAINGETADILKEAQGGYCGEAENAAQLAENIMKLFRSGRAGCIGKKNYQYYLEHFTKDKFMQRLIKILEEKANV